MRQCQKRTTWSLLLFLLEKHDILSTSLGTTTNFNTWLSISKKTMKTFREAARKLAQWLARRLHVQLLVARHALLKLFAHCKSATLPWKRRQLLVEAEAVLAHALASAQAMKAAQKIQMKVIAQPKSLLHRLYESLPGMEVETTLVRLHRTFEAGLVRSFCLAQAEEVEEAEAGSTTAGSEDGRGMKNDEKCRNRFDNAFSSFQCFLDKTYSQLWGHTLHLRSDKVCSSFLFGFMRDFTLEGVSWLFFGCLVLLWIYSGTM